MQEDGYNDKMLNSVNFLSMIYGILVHEEKVVQPFRNFCK